MALLLWGASVALKASLPSLRRSRACAACAPPPPAPYAPLAPGASVTIAGRVLVSRHADLLRLELLSEPSAIQSEWHLSRRLAPDYAGAIAERARAALPRGGQLLLLGLGGGSIAGQLLCGASAAAGVRVAAVEADAAVAAAARDYFFPAMFAGSRRRAARRLRVAVADARRVAAGDAPPPRGAAGPYDVIVEDFAYAAHGGVGVGFWRALRERHAAPRATLLVNTLYTHFTEHERLERDLRRAGWGGIRRTVERGLQAEAAAEAAAEAWTPGDNMIVSAVNLEGER
ncbi:hypothetical protein AB1Y20_011859 [Prymnesium parvum]|uniref:Spermidine synthase n=1 Tax=Prymnesium parvum TaxID=97485 RepID=A0AB34IK90_PRYPA